MLVGEYAVKFDFFLSVFFFNSFNFLVFIILLSLLRGLTWEVFIVVDSVIKPEAANNWVKYTKFYSKSLNSKDIDKKINSSDDISDKKSKFTLVCKRKSQEKKLSNFKSERSADNRSSFHKSTKNEQKLEGKNSSVKEVSKDEEDSKDEKELKSEKSNSEMKKKEVEFIGENLIDDSFEKTSLTQTLKPKLPSSIYIYNNISFPLPSFEFHSILKSLPNFKVNEDEESIKNTKDSQSNNIIFESFPKKIEVDKDPYEGKSSKNNLKNENEIDVMKKIQQNRINALEGKIFKSTAFSNNSLFTESRDKKIMLSFLKKKIKRLNYYINLQIQKNEKNPENKFDENTDFFDGKDSNSLKTLEELLLNNFEDEEMVDNLLPKKNDSPMKRMSSEIKIAPKKKNAGINYGNSKDFLLKKAFLKDFNMDQIKVFNIFIFNDRCFRNLK